MPIAEDGQNESVATSYELQPTAEPLESTTEDIVQTTIPPIDTTTEISLSTSDEPIESKTKNAVQTTAGLTDTTTEIVYETTTERAESSTENAVQTTTELPDTTTGIVNETSTESAESTTESVVQTTSEPLELTTSGAEGSEATTLVNNTMPAEVVKDKLSEQIRKILKHYQRPDPVGFPGAPIPDPLSIPPMNKDFGMAYMTFKNMTVHGLSKFKVENVNTDLKNMRVSEKKKKILFLFIYFIYMDERKWYL